MTYLYTQKIITDDNKFGVQKRRYRVIKARSMAEVFDRVNKLTRWGWVLDSIGGITPRVTVSKTEIIPDNGEQSKVAFCQRYDAETKKMVNVYHRYATRWELTHSKMINTTNTMLACGYEVTSHLTTTFGYRVVFAKVFVKDALDDVL
jgi:hypothetical protein